jgi:hypothetical protein
MSKKMKRKITSSLFAILILFVAVGNSEQNKALHAAEKTQPASLDSGTPLRTAKTIARLTPSADGRDDTAAINAALDALRQADGGTLLIAAGTYTLASGVNLDKLRDVRILGLGMPLLKLAPGIVTHVEKGAMEGGASVTVRDAGVIRKGMRLEFHCPGRRIVPPSGKAFTQPFIGVEVKSVSGNEVALEHPLQATVPMGTTVINAYNAFEGHRGISNVTIQNIMIDMNRKNWPVRPLNHTQHCAFFLSGSYSYETGPTGPPIEGFRIIRCVIRGAHHRGAAFYQAAHSGVYSCEISDTGAEGIDFDHFCTYCEASGNTLTDCGNIELNDASYCLVQGNSLHRCRGGVNIWQWCRLPGLNTGNLILNNNFFHCSGVAVRCETGADNNFIVGNNITALKAPAIIIRGADNVLLGNTVEGLGDGAVADSGEGTQHLNE